MLVTRKTNRSKTPCSKILHHSLIRHQNMHISTVPPWKSDRQVPLDVQAVRLASSKVISNIFQPFLGSSSSMSYQHVLCSQLSKMDAGSAVKVPRSLMTTSARQFPLAGVCHDGPKAPFSDLGNAQNSTSRIFFILFQGQGARV